MFDALAELGVPWPDVHLFQVDERVAPRGDPARNLTVLEAHLVDRVQVPASQVHRMPVETVDREDAAARYAEELRAVAGHPVVLDLVHLGLGADGHTASLVPGDPVLEAMTDVAMSGVYQGHRRMTLTYPLLARARRILWLVTSGVKRSMLERLIRGDPRVPAGCVAQDAAEVVIGD